MNTKKIIFLSVFLVVAFGISAQIDYSASQIAYSSLSFSQRDPILGTARYSGMGGALGALGGDATTLKDNPAGVGIYRKSDLTITPNVYISNDNSLGFNINNFAFILNFKNSRGNSKGYVTSSLGVNYNRLKNFSRHSFGETFDATQSMTDYIDAYAKDYLYNDFRDLELIKENGSSWFPLNGGEFDNQIRYTESGSIGEWNFSYGVNISNLVYLGISTGFVNMNYRLKTQYDEFAVEESDSWYLDNDYEATGSGFNFKFGAIVAPTDFLRVGLAFHTPTFYNINEYISETIEVSAFDYNDDRFREVSYKSDLQTPLKAQGSLGFIIGKRAIIGLEYQFEDFSAMRFYSDGDLDQASKDIMNSEMNITHTAKAGLEVQVVGGLSLRAGFAFVSSPVTKLAEEVYSDPKWFQQNALAQPQNTFYYTGGIGYRGKYFYADLAYVHQTRDEFLFEYLPQQSYTPYSLTLHHNNITTTLGFRF